MAIKIANINPLEGVRSRIDREVKATLIRQGELLVKASRRRSPVKTGRLRRSIDRIVIPIRDGWRLWFGSGVTGGKQVHYATYQEHGTIYMPPKYFIHGPFDEKIRRMNNAILRAIRKAFK